MQKPACKDLGRNGQSPTITPKAAYTPASTRIGSRLGGVKMFKWLHRRKQPQTPIESTPVKSVNADEAAQADEWEEVPNYLEVDPANELTASLIAAAVTADTAPDAKLVLKHLYVENPEAKRVGLIASAIAAGDGHGHYVVKSIKKKVD
ncbi:hypothetical protein FD51_GL002966 [Lacticaseibacillus zeae DSM 20178 = KCTC 3804]|uniref:Uncharacterized protein n=2 Tax=Lacticaseibacillus zeae TaxID=57037 RepID=A0A0R1EZ43_LACZE|nr:hypothetical protein FD51_GL002966 [Lacticaseibacillus zeae DSM 20178 = KCTC 3804]